MGDEQWHTEVEGPTRELALVTLPTLSDGWGRSVGLLSVGWVCGGLSWFVWFDRAGAFLLSSPVWFRALGWCLVLGCTLVPVMFSIDPATASSSCARLEDHISTLCVEDPGQPRRMNFLKSLKCQNKDQGL